ncbi:mucin-binding protein [Limosilactobacillus sp.]|uniref:mucin-binding protein n=1 Tax=Limosilactobacillus sp. TaxID=2773925 RepID=UPI0025C5A89B|nr:hypothetical protein [Limosilactobacillus sp.]MCH3922780.1 hypothetical protein [Limosilactobacillus sp.]MCH3927463.1 hypothetical protein [Limosilactobacillus sp.]
MQHNKFYHRSMVSLLSATALLGLATMPVLAEQNDGDASAPPVATPAVTSPDNTGEQSVARTQKVTRTIEYTNPITGERKEAVQTAVLKYDQDGNQIDADDAIWPEFFMPSFDGYLCEYSVVRAQKITKDDVRSLKYYLIYAKEHTTPAQSILKLVDINRQNVVPDIKVNFAADEMEKMIDLPTPPAGWEYVNDLPAKVPISRYTAPVELMVRKSAPAASHQETKELTRRIIVHLPSGDKTITQKVTATRTVQTDHGKTTTGEWQIPAFAEYKAPSVDGYVADQLTIPAQQLDPNQLTDQLAPVEIHYQKEEPAKGDTTGEQPDKTGDDQSTTTDPGDKQTDPETKDEGVGDDTIDPGDQQKPAIKDEGVGDDTIDSGDIKQPETKDEGSQTDPDPSTKDEGVGDDTIDPGETERPGTKDEGSQTDPTPSTKDEGVGDDTIDPDETAQPGTKDEGSQTDPTPSTKDEGVGDDTIDPGETERPETKDEGSQTDPTPSTKDEGASDDTIDPDEMKQPETKDEGSQTDPVAPPSTTDGSSDDAAAPDDKRPTGTTDTGSQTDPVPTTKDEGTETEPVPSVDQGTQTDDAAITDRGASTSKGNQESQTDEPSSTIQKKVGEQSKPNVMDQQPQSENDGQNQSMTASQSNDEVDPLAFHDRLSQLQEPLTDLTKATPNQDKQGQDQLPQTGNHRQPATLQALVAAVCGLLFAWWPLRKKGQ